MNVPPKITPCLWFNFNAEEAVAHCHSVFRNGRTVTIARYGKAGPGPEGAVMTILFEIEGQRFLDLNGGPQFRFTPAISLILDCETQDEVDRLWERLGEGGTPGQCGWLTDKFGVSWQVVPRVLPEIMQRGGAAATERAMRAAFSMQKLDADRIRQAYEVAN